MKKQLLFLLVAMVLTNGYSQITFEKGYFITNGNQKTECFIKNDDWKNNPSNFRYKMTEDGEIQTQDIAAVKEFGVYNNSKFIRATVKIDRSSNAVSDLSDQKSPILNEEQLFLKVLIEGNASLYYYEDGNLKRYFYSQGNSEIVQLIHKRYKTSGGDIATNNQFKQQLLSDLVCSTITRNSIDGVAYKKKSLIRFFMDYNSCVNSDIVNYEPIQKEDLFNLTLRPRLVNASLDIQNSVSDSRDTSFGNELGFGFGIEAEFILPFNKNKWGIIVEPTYQNFKSQETIEVDFAVNGQLNVEADYKSIELPIGVRYYFFLDDNSKIFINAAYVLDFNSSSSIEFIRTDGSTFDSLEIETRNNAAFGLGYIYRDRYSLEFRYMTSRDVLNGYPSWSSDYQAFSVIAGFTLF
jgi:hypothetical protein